MQETILSLYRLNIKVCVLLKPKGPHYYGENFLCNAPNTVEPAIKRGFSSHTFSFPAKGCSSAPRERPRGHRPSHHRDEPREINPLHQTTYYDLEKCKKPPASFFLLSGSHHPHTCPHTCPHTPLTQLSETRLLQAQPSGLASYHQPGSGAAACVSRSLKTFSTLGFQEAANFPFVTWSLSSCRLPNLYMLKCPRLDHGLFSLFQSHSLRR